MITKADKNQLRKKRHLRIRNKVSGTTARPRLCVFRSAKHVYAQIIDDNKGITLVSASTLDKELKETLAYTGNKDAAKAVGTLIAKRAVEAGIKVVVFDRGGYIYHGRVLELATAAREAGLDF